MRGQPNNIAMLVTLVRGGGGGGAFIYTYFSKKFVCVKLGDFLSKKCKLSFFVQYIYSKVINTGVKPLVPLLSTESFINYTWKNLLSTESIDTLIVSVNTQFTSIFTVML